MNCRVCGKSNAIRYRMRTAYADDEKNYAILCPECQEESDEYWTERWNDYYDMIGHV